MQTKTRNGLERLVEILESSSKLDPSQTKMATKAIDDLLHAMSVRDVRGANKAVDQFARIFLRLPPKVNGRR